MPLPAWPPPAPVFPPGAGPALLPNPPPLADTVPATAMLPLLCSRQLPVHLMVELLSTENKELACKTPRVVDMLLPEKVRLDEAMMESVMNIDEPV